MPFGKMKLTIERYREDALSEFKETAEMLRAGGNVYLDSNQIHLFINFLASLNFKSDYSLAELRDIEKKLLDIPRTLSIVDCEGEEFRENIRILRVIEDAKAQIVTLKVHCLFNKH